MRWQICHRRSVSSRFSCFVDQYYAPNNTYDVVDFYENLRTTLLESDYDQDYKFIMGGDFNVPLHLQFDSY